MIGDQYRNQSFSMYSLKRLIWNKGGINAKIYK